MESKLRGNLELSPVPRYVVHKGESGCIVLGRADWLASRLEFWQGWSTSHSLTDQCTFLGETSLVWKAYDSVDPLNTLRNWSRVRAR